MHYYVGPPNTLSESQQKVKKNKKSSKDEAVVSKEAQCPPVISKKVKNKKDAGAGGSFAKIEKTALSEDDILALQNLEAVKEFKSNLQLQGRRDKASLKEESGPPKKAPPLPEIEKKKKIKKHAGSASGGIGFGGADSSESDVLALKNLEAVKQFEADCLKMKNTVFMKPIEVPKTVSKISKEDLEMKKAWSETYGSWTLNKGRRALTDNKPPIPLYADNFSFKLLLKSDIRYWVLFLSLDYLDNY